jgi:L-lactate dehydrogenase complex protein LldE
MKVGLFIPYYIDAFFPQVGIATLELLEKIGCSVEYPLEQNCCVRCFQDLDTVVGPSASCVHHVRFCLDAIEQTPEVSRTPGASLTLRGG